MRDIFTLSKALPLAFGTALMWLALARSGEASFERSLTPGIAVMMGAVVLTSLFSVDLPLSILGPHQQQFYALLPLSLCALAYYAAANLDIHPSTFIMLALLGGLAVSLPALSQIGGKGFMAWSIQDGRAGSTFGSPIFLGSYLALLVPLAWSRMGQKSWAVLVLISAALLASGSRGSMMAAAAGILLIEFVRNKKVALLVGMLIPILALVILNRHLRGSHDSDIGRIEVWRIALIAWKSHPIFGWGPDTFSLAFRQFMTQRFIDANGHNDTFIQLSAHSDVLQVLTTMGLVGLAAYGFFIARVVKLLRYAVRLDPEALGIAGAMMALFINAKFNPIPLAVLVVAACLLGSLDRSRYYDEARHVRSWIMAAASVIVFAVFAIMCKAERHQRLAENLKQMGYRLESAEQFNLAAKTNPFDLWYTQRQLDTFWSTIQFMPGVDKNLLAEFSHNISDNISRLHPNDPTAHELRALSYKFEGDMIGRDRYWECSHELEVAIRLAPRFSIFENRRAELARLIKRQRS